MSAFVQQVKSLEAQLDSEKLNTVAVQHAVRCL